jgi:hypothetical protein
VNLRHRLVDLVGVASVAPVPGIVLVVENHPAVGRALTELFVAMGRPARLVGGRFFELLRPEPWDGVDAAVVDYHLDEVVTGGDLLTYLAESHPGVCRILLTASPLSILPGPDVAVADFVFRKPVGIDALLAAVERRS